MKKCPKCNRTYGDDTLSFCLEDGALLSADYDPDVAVAFSDEYPRRPADRQNYSFEKSVPTVVSPPRDTHRSARQTVNPHLIYAGAGLVAVILVVGSIVWLNSGSRTLQATSNSASTSSTPLQQKTVANTPGPPSSENKLQVSSSPFEVKSTSAHYVSDLVLLGGYEVSVPADDQWYDTKIMLYPNNQMQIGFTKDTEGNVEIRAGNVSGSFSKAQPDSIWYEYDLVNRPPRSRFDHVFMEPATLRVRSTERDVVIKIDVRQL